MKTCLNMAGSSVVSLAVSCHDSHVVLTPERRSRMRALEQARGGGGEEGELLFAFFKFLYWARY